jgi:hypothetical protein
MKKYLWLICLIWLVRIYLPYGGTTIEYRAKELAVSNGGTYTMVLENGTMAYASGGTIIATEVKE